MIAIDISFLRLRNIVIMTFLLSTVNPTFSQTYPSDFQVTTQTKNLYINLLKHSEKGVMLGHQDDLASGVFWKELDNKSDLKDVVGEYPAVFGWDIGHLELDKAQNFDHVSFSKLKGYILSANARGGINTISWHCNNPVKPEESVRDTSKTFQSINKLFSDSILLVRYKDWLDKVADFVLNLSDKNGNLIPIIFRPLHENTGNWFWWGKSHCTPEEYIKLWRFTFDYLKNKKKVHNLLYAYSTSTFKTREEYLERYPGDSFVDILGIDSYDNASNDSEFSKKMTFMIETLKQLNVKKGKVIAITETGIKLSPNPNWWTQVLSPLLHNSGLSYVLLWRNGNTTSFWSTYPGQSSSKNFKEFHEDKTIFFESYLKNINFYK